MDTNMATLNINNKYTSSYLNKVFLYDDRLSWKAKGLLSHMLCMPEYSTVTVKYLAKCGSDGRTAIYSGLSELERFGYVVGKVNCFSRSRDLITYYIFDIPQAINYPLPDASTIQSRITMLTRAKKKSMCSKKSMPVGIEAVLICLKEATNQGHHNEF